MLCECVLAEVGWVTLYTEMRGRIQEEDTSVATRCEAF